MNEIQNVDTLTTEILILKQQTAQSMIEIGKRLLIVKESLPHGEWGKWLEEKVDFKQTTASKFMRVAKEFSDLKDFGSLSPSKIFALLELPQEERCEFIQSNPVDKMSTREMQRTIRSRKAIPLTTSKHLINRTSGKCEVCGWGGIGLENILVPHHIVKYSNSEDNSIDNLAMICPNCHNIIHVLERCKDKDMVAIIESNIAKNILPKINHYVSILTNSEEVCN